MLQGNQVYISYARKDVHFAESLAVSLIEQHEINAWLDLHKLPLHLEQEPDREQALQDSHAMILVVSPASVQSKHCRREWQSALEARIPVYLAVIEATHLPPELQGMKAVDFQGRFRKALRKLVDALDSYQPTEVHTPIPSIGSILTKNPSLQDQPAVNQVPASNRFKLRWKYPPWVWLVSVVIGIWGLLSLSTVVISLYGLSFLVPMTLMTTVWIGYDWWRWMTRRYNLSILPSRVILYGFATFFLYMMAVVYVEYLPFIDLPFDRLESEQAGKYVFYGMVIIGINSLLSLIVLVISNRSPDLFRYVSAGYASQSTRFRILGFRKKERTFPQDSERHVTYQLHHVYSDEKFAKEIHKHFGKAGLTEAPYRSDEEVDYQVLLFSNFIKKQEVENAFARDDKVISIAATDITVSPEIAPYTAHHWVDYRNNSRRTLKQLAKRLQNPSFEEFQYIWNTIPENFEKSRRFPTGVGLLIGLLLLNSIILIVSSFLEFTNFLEVVSQTNSTGDIQSSGFVGFLGAIVAGLTALIMWKRQLKFPLYIGLVILLVILRNPLSIIFFVLTIGAIWRWTPSEVYSQGDFALSRKIFDLRQLGSPILIIITFAVTGYSFQRFDAESVSLEQTTIRTVQVGDIQFDIPTTWDNTLIENENLRPVANLRGSDSSFVDAIELYQNNFASIGKIEWISLYSTPFSSNWIVVVGYRYDLSMMNRLAYDTTSPRELMIQFEQTFNENPEFDPETTTYQLEGIEVQVLNIGTNPTDTQEILVSVDTDETDYIFFITANLMAIETQENILETFYTSFKVSS